MIDWQVITDSIQQAIQRPFQILDSHSVGGGCINTAYRLEGKDESFFVKLNRLEMLPMFAAEFAGIEEMARCAAVRVPGAVTCGTTGSHAFLVLHYIPLHSRNAASDRLLGRQLARQHRQRQPFFGWHRDNTIGSTPQPNRSHADWVAFWREQRLAFQLQLAAERGHGGRLQKHGERLCASLEAFFSDYSPQPALLHGDLWSGNAAADTQGQPVIFDPACYYGDREADLAMTELFGGFSNDFYAAYNESWALDPGYAIRKSLYNLYHVLNHLNLFGGGYRRQAEALQELLLAELG